MRILLINPNTSEHFTKKIQFIAKKYASSETDVVTVNPTTGPSSIEGIYDELLSVKGALTVFLENLDDFDAFAIACFSDHPVIYAAREITDKPVLGITEASMYLACMVGYRFSVVTTNREWEPLLWDAVNHYGLGSRCASVRTTGLPVLALETVGSEETYQLILKISQNALEMDGADVICLGCAGMAGMDKDLEKELNVPVIDGVAGAIKLLEGMISYGLRTSKRLKYAYPNAKELVNLPEIFKKPHHQ
jgi:allantoin racemase